MAYIDSTYRTIVSLLPERLRPYLYFIVGLRKYIPGTVSYKKRIWVRGVYHKLHDAQRSDMMVGAIMMMWTNRPVIGNYFEFGSHSGITMRMAYDNFSHLNPDMKFVPFDSFEGLPKIQDIDKMEIFHPGANKTSLERFRKIIKSHGIPDRKIIIVKGYFEESLNEETKNSLLPEKAAFIYIDVDIYSATKEALVFCRNFLQPGTIIMFGGWNCFYGDPDRGQRRAFREFRDENPDLQFSDFSATYSLKLFTFVKQCAGDAKTD